MLHLNAAPVSSWVRYKARTTERQERAAEKLRSIFPDFLPPSYTPLARKRGLDAQRVLEKQLKYKDSYLYKAKRYVLPALIPVVLIGLYVTYFILPIRKLKRDVKAGKLQDLMKKPLSFLNMHELALRRELEEQEEILAKLQESYSEQEKLIQLKSSQELSEYLGNDDWRASTISTDDASPAWIESNECCVCQQRLGKLRTNHKHHCRFCRKAVCASHSQHKESLPESQTLERICDICKKLQVGNVLKAELSFKRIQTLGLIEEVKTSTEEVRTRTEERKTECSVLETRKENMERMTEITQKSLIERIASETERARKMTATLYNMYAAVELEKNGKEATEDRCIHKRKEVQELTEEKQAMTADLEAKECAIKKKYRQLQRMVSQAEFEYLHCPHLQREPEVLFQPPPSSPKNSRQKKEAITAEGCHVKCALM